MADFDIRAIGELVVKAFPGRLGKVILGLLVVALVIGVCGWAYHLVFLPPAVAPIMNTEASTKEGDNNSTTITNAPVAAAAPKRTFYRRHLLAFYKYGRAIQEKMINPNASDDEVNSAVGEMNRWSASSYAWIDRNMGAAAAQKFNDLSSGASHPYAWHGDHPDQLAKNRYSAINALTFFCENLEQMIDKDTWDAPSKR